jgi:histidine triad (HIT) family protein
MAEPDFDKMSPEEIAEYQRQNCIFCKIIKGEIPSRKAYEDDKIIAVLDINPAAKGHVLMMTKEHYPILPVIPPEISAHMFKITKELSIAIKKAMICDKITLFVANGGIAGQQSPHFLYHIIPRENLDGLDNFNIPSKEAKEEEIAPIMPALRARLSSMMKGYDAKFKKTENNNKIKDINTTNNNNFSNTINQSQKTKELNEIEETKKDNSQNQITNSKQLHNNSFEKTNNSQSQPSSVMDQQELAKFIFNNPKIKEKITKDPENFKREIDNDPELKIRFSGINIVKLAEALRKMGV